MSKLGYISINLVFFFMEIIQLGNNPYFMCVYIRKYLVTFFMRNNTDKIYSDYLHTSRY